MVYNVPFLRLVLSGELYSYEQFSMGLNFVGSGQADAPDEVPPDVVDACVDFWSTSSLIARGARLTTLKLNLIGTDGRYERDETVQYDFPSFIPGTGTSWDPPAQIALAVSTTTSSNRGRAHAGRFFVPLPGRQNLPDGLLGAAEAGEMATAAALWITSLNVALPEWDAHVMSNIGTGTARRITGVKVGRVLDTIRSRRGDFPEDYQEKPVS
jgi:hypothetical protein